METTIVICGNLGDFNRWLFNNLYGYTHRSRTRRIIVDDRRYLAVSEVEHMCGYRCDTVSYTTLGRERENFDRLFTMATQYCLARPKKEFKFGR